MFLHLNSCQCLAHSQNLSLRAAKHKQPMEYAFEVRNIVY